MQGSVEIVAWDKNEVELVAELESDKDQLEFEATARKVRIEVDRPDHHMDATTRSLLDGACAARGAPGRRHGQRHHCRRRRTRRAEPANGERRGRDTGFRRAGEAASVSGEVTITGNGGKAAVKTENVSGTSTVTGVRGTSKARL